MKLKLYAAKMSSATPVINALDELGVEAETVFLDLPNGDQRDPEFLAHNPNGKVPTLLVDGAPMFEAVAIMQWLGEQYGVKKKLWPASGTPERLQALSWSTWAYVTYGSVIQNFIKAASPRVPSELHSPAQAAQLQNEADDLLSILNQKLAGREWLLGDEFGLVDLIVGCTIIYGSYCGLAFEAYDNVRRWLERFQARPAFKSAWQEMAAA